MRRSLWLTLSLGIAASLAVAGTAFATHAPGGTTAVLLARGTLAEKVKVNVGDIKIQTKGLSTWPRCRSRSLREAGQPDGTSTRAPSSW